MGRWLTTLAWLFLLSALTAMASPAAAGTLRGLVKDKDSGDELIGVDLVLVGHNIKAATDIDGRFEITGLAAGAYELRLTYLGYNARFLSDLQVRADGVLDLEIIMESFQAHAGGEVMVSASRVLSTESAILANRRQATIIGDAISAAQISRSPDGTSGEALNRVTGLTVTEGKFVIVRGMPDRYNTTTLNDVPVSGTNVDKDRKSFSFDLVPSNLLSNLTVLKSVRPDMPGDVTGGLVQVGTLEFPAESTTMVGFSAGHAVGSTGEEFSEDAASGGRDWLAMDDGGRDIPDLENRFDTAVRNEVARALDNRWSFATRRAPPKLSFNLAHGNKKRAPGGDLGYLGAFSYRNKYDIEETDEERQPDENGTGAELNSAGAASNYEVLWGGLANLYYRLGENHRIGVTNTYTRSADSVAETAAGSNSDKVFTWRKTSWQERYQYVTRLDGRHDLEALASGLALDWGAFYGESSATEPDMRFVSYNTGSDRPRMDNNLRSWTWLDEIRRGWNADVQYSFAEHLEDEDRAVKLKAGLGREERTRRFDMEAWISSPTFMASSRELAYLPPDSIFAPENYNEVYDERRGALFNFVPETRFSGVYDAGHELRTTFFVAELPFTLFQEDLRLVGGVRVEDSDQQVIALPDAASDRADTARVDETDYLPSLNLTWTYDEDFNLRLAYFKSVNRPEFRELAPVLRRNYTTYQNERGNPDLERAEIDNYDLRAEYFPGFGEVLAASFFYKELSNAIEDSLTPSPEGALLTWTNAPKGRNYGLELEARKKLDYTSYTEDLTLTVNYTRIWSEVEVVENLTKDTFLRPLQGQAPWLVNLNLMYSNPNTGTSVNVLFNKIGRRLDKVGGYGEVTNVYLEPRDRLDFVVTQDFLTRCKAKLAVKNILAADEIRTSGGENAYEYSRVSSDPEYSLSLSAKF